MNILVGIKKLCIFFFFGGGGVITKLGLFLGSFLYIFFLKVKVQIGNIFWGRYNFRHFGGGGGGGVCLIFLIFLFGKQ